MSTPPSAPAKRPSAFARLYAWMERLAKHPRAPWWLGGVSAAESSFFPIPPDVMLIPMVLEQPRAWLRLATVTTLSSVAGGVFGWLIGHFLIAEALPLIERLGYGPAYETTRDFVARYGFWALIIKGLTPLPYKIFTITAGAADMALLPFILASFVGRGMRFYLVAGVMRAAGPAVEPALKKYIDVVGWSVIALIVSGLVWLKL